MAPQALSGLFGSFWPGLRRGQAGEALACRHLAGQGFVILCRNFRCRSGELDIVARDPDGTIVFVEVKERGGAGHGAGYEAVTFGKRLRVLRAARFYAAGRGLGESAIRFDVISVDWRVGRPSIRHDRGAFDEDGL